MSEVGVAFSGPLTVFIVLTRFVQTQLYGIVPNDPASIGWPPWYWSR